VSGRWLVARHSLPAEAAAVLALYGVYELSRAFVAGSAGEARRHALQVVAVERWPHLLVEADVQHAARLVPGLEGVLGIAYLTLHLIVTIGVLLWFHQRRPAAFPFVRTALLVASGLALAGFLAFPTAPPRLAGIGVVDTVSNAHVDLNHGLVSSVYNPYAAIPSMHVGYALIVAASVYWYSRRTLVRAIAPFYPPFVLLAVVATGNHFFLDAAAGALVAGLAIGVAALLSAPGGEMRGFPT
jgi:PAP2 superfamily